MRFILVAVVLVVGLQVGTTAIKKVDSIQQNKMDQLCKIDPTLCQSD